MRGRALRLGAAVAATLLLAVLPACGLLHQGPSNGYEVTARFSEAINVYRGGPVRLLGVSVGRISSVKNVGSEVDVTLKINGNVTLPADVGAMILPISAIGERSVTLSPAYRGGDKLAPGAVITNTATPAEFDQLLSSLGNFAGAIDPKVASDAITRLNQLVSGEGAKFNDLLRTGSSTLAVLANKSTELGALTDAVAALTSTLSAHTSTITSLIDHANDLSAVLAANTGPLNATITNLQLAATTLSDLLSRHSADFTSDISTLTQTFRTLDRNLDNLGQTYSALAPLVAIAPQLYDPSINAITVNNVFEAGNTGDVIASYLRDRVSSLCRRLTARLGVATFAQLCGDPATNPLNPVASLIPGLLGQLPGLNNPTVPPPTASRAAPQTAPTPSTAPSQPAQDASAADALNQLQSRLGAPLDSSQRDALAGLNARVLGVLQALDPQQLASLNSLTPDQLHQLGQVPLDQVVTTLQGFTDALDPASRLDPILPGGQSLNGLLDQLLGPVG